MNTDMQTTSSNYTKDRIRYDDSQIDTILSDLAEVLSLLSEVDSEVAALEAKDRQWHGKSKQQYKELKRFVKRYRTDYGTSIQELQTAISGLKQLLGAIPSSPVIQEINGVE